MSDDINIFQVLLVKIVMYIGNNPFKHSRFQIRSRIVSAETVYLHHVHVVRSRDSRCRNAERRSRRG